MFEHLYKKKQKFGGSGYCLLLSISSREYVLAHSVNGRETAPATCQLLFVFPDKPRGLSEGTPVFMPQERSLLKTFLEWGRDRITALCNAGRGGIKANCSTSMANTGMIN